MRGSQPRVWQGRPYKPESKKWLGPLGRLPRGSRCTAEYGWGRPGSKVPAHVDRYRLGVERQGRSRG